MTDATRMRLGQLTIIGKGREKEELDSPDFNGRNLHRAGRGVGSVHYESAVRIERREKSLLCVHVGRFDAQVENFLEPGFTRALSNVCHVVSCCDFALR